MTVPGNDKSIAQIASELWQLFLSYAKQETVEPLKGLGRQIGYGVGAMFLFPLGILLLTLSWLRGLETHTEEHLTGNWSWVPYAAALVLMIILIVFAVSRIKKGARR